MNPIITPPLGEVEIGFAELCPRSSFLPVADYDHTGNAIYGDNADDNDDADDNDEADADDDENAPEECFQELVQWSEQVSPWLQAPPWSRSSLFGSSLWSWA